MNWKLSGDYFVLPSDEEMDQRMNTQDMKGTRLFLLVFFPFEVVTTQHAKTPQFCLFLKKKKKKKIRQPEKEDRLAKEMRKKPSITHTQRDKTNLKVK
jgi:hypothetical protein